MLVLPNLTEVPPGGWQYKVPETGKEFKKLPSLHALMTELRKHYLATGYNAPSDLALKVEEYMCHLPELEQYCEAKSESLLNPTTKSTDLPKILFHTMHAAIQCMRTLIAHRVSGDGVTQELANKRAEYCSVCPENSEVTGCRSCSSNSLQDLTNSILGGKSTPHDPGLMYCNACHCSTKAKVWVSHEAIWNHMPRSQKKKLDPNCWILAEAPEE